MTVFYIIVLITCFYVVYLWGWTHGVDDGVKVTWKSWDKVFGKK